MTSYMTINGKKVPFNPGESVLDAATNAGIFIPTLCARPDLPSYGACRLCIVDVEGVRGYPNSCTLPAQEHMVVRTSTPDLQSIRRNIFELILSEHPSVCIVCKNREECDSLRFGSTKAGRVIGCNTCSQKEVCEIRKLADYFRIRDIHYPLIYKDLPLERYDPFMERDYNLCILCDRCVRACQEVLGHSAIALTKRGHDTKVGTLLDVPHLESGCVFCGHCIDVCPTGALTARDSKWYGKPDVSVETTCTMCSHNCQLIADVKWGKVVSFHPETSDKMSARREYCVKGRFTVPGLINGLGRLKYPTIKRGELTNELYPVEWDDAIQFLTEHLRKYGPEEVGFFISPFLSDESIFVLTKLAKDVAGSKIAFDNSDLLNLESAGIKFLYATQQAIRLAEMKEVEFLVLSDWQESHYQELASVVLPATTFVEEDGTKTGVEFMQNYLHKAADPPGYALPDWQIASMVGRALGLEGYDYQTLEDVRDDMAQSLMGSVDVPLVPKEGLEYRGVEIAKKVDDFRYYLVAKRNIAEESGVEFHVKF